MKVKTPEGALKTPAVIGLPKRDDDGESDATPKLENTEFECGLTDSSCGFGPISVLLKKLLPGRYHVYAHAKSSTVKEREIGWPDSTALLTFYGSSREQWWTENWSGETTFVCPRDGAGDWWDVCFLDVDDDGKIAVRPFNCYSVEEPGYRTIAFSALDVYGKRSEEHTSELQSP